MGQGSQAQPPAQRGQAGGLAVFNPQHPALAGLQRPEIMQQLGVLLQGSPLTPERLIVDLGAYLTANPTLHQYIQASGLYNCVVTAARFQTTFGDGGLWIIPEAGNIRPQESEKFIVQRAKEESGIERITPVLIYETDEPDVQYTDSGRIAGFQLGRKFSAVRTKDNLIGGFGVATYEDGRPDFIQYFDMTDLNRRRDHSAAYKRGSAPSWKDDPLQMYERSIRAAVGRDLAPIRTRVPGMAGSLVMSGFGEVTDAEFSDVAAPQGLMDSLNAQAELPAPAGLVPPTVEEMPEALRDKLAAGMVQAAFSELCEAYGRLPDEPHALSNLRRDRGLAWSQGLGEDESLSDMSLLLGAFWDKAEKDGHPQPARAAAPAQPANGPTEQKSEAGMDATAGAAPPQSQGADVPASSPEGAAAPASSGPEQLKPIDRRKIPQDIRDQIKQAGGVATADNALGKAYQELPSDVEALSLCWRTHAVAWGQDTKSTGEVQMLSRLADIYWEAAAAEGYPQPNRV